MREEAWSEGGGEMLGGGEREGAGREGGRLPAWRLPAASARPVFSDGERQAESREAALKTIPRNPS